MPAPEKQPGTPQFETAEYAGKPDTERCALCHGLVGETYYRVNGAQSCGACAEKARTSEPADRHSDFARALLFGAGGAIVGLILYATFAIVTGLVIGYVSLAVGYIVGKAMRAGSRGMGGRRYQIAAALLTYASVSVAAIPVAITQEIKQHKAPKAAISSPQPDGNQRSPGSAGQPGKAQPVEKPNLGAVLGILVLIGLASPFLELQDPFHGIIGLVILFVGIRIAWKMMAGSARVDVLGPFRNRSAAASAGSGG